MENSANNKTMSKERENFFEENKRVVRIEFNFVNEKEVRQPHIGVHKLSLKSPHICLFITCIKTT